MEIPRMTVAVALTLTLGGCASVQTQKATTDPPGVSRLTAAEMAQYPNIVTALDAIQQLRPHYLRPFQLNRGVSTLSDSDPKYPTPSWHTPFYVNGKPASFSLGDLPAKKVEEIQFLGTQGSELWFGRWYTSPTIAITLKSE